MTTALAVALALLLPTLVGISHGPAAGLYGQLLALALWGGVMLVTPRTFRPGLGLALLLAALALLLLGVVRAAWAGNPGVAVEPLIVLLAAAELLALGACGERDALVRGLAWGCLAVGLAASLIAIVQVLIPGWADGHWIVATSMPGRAIGNMRQPNHLATWLLLAMVALTWLAQQRHWPWWVTALGLQLLVFALVLTGSRAGLFVGLPLLALWAALGRGLERRSRWLLLATLLMAALAWGLLHAWAAAGHGQFAAEQRLDQEGAGSPKRLQILLNAWQLLLQNPWGGVGWGSFNRAWTLSVFPDRPAAFFDHTHNLPMQLLVELGWLHGGIIVLLLVVATALLLRRWWRLTDAAAPLALVAPMLIVLGFHSLLEYPLWHPYFLLPAALMAGLAVGQSEPAASARWPARLPTLIGLLALLVTVLALISYQRVAAVFAPASDGTPLLLRLDEAVRDPIYGFHGDYAAAVTIEPGEQAAAAAARAARHFIDARLLKAWATSLQVLGEVDKARYLSARIAEFGPTHSAEWRAECAQADKAWRCQLPTETHHWRDF